MFQSLHVVYYANRLFSVVSFLLSTRLSSNPTHVFKLKSTYMRIQFLSVVHEAFLAAHQRTHVL
jgi:hypothetical protein